MTMPVMYILPHTKRAIKERGREEKEKRKEGKEEGKRRGEQKEGSNEPL